GMAGERITAAANGTRWPALAEALPSGPLRDRLEGGTWVRALLPAAKGASTVSEVRLWNADDKTGAWLPLGQPHPAEPPRARRRRPAPAAFGPRRPRLPGAGRADRKVPGRPAAGALRRAARAGRGPRYGGPGPGRVHEQGRRGAQPCHARAHGAGGGAAAAARHPRGEPPGHGAGRR